MEYRRAKQEGGTYFFTVNLANRKSSLLTDHIEKLRNSIYRTKQRHPFRIEAIVVLPDHIHTLWTLPEKDTNYPMRWSLIKSGFSRQLPKVEPINESRLTKRERGIWQRRYWEHQIRDRLDYQRHIDYIHYNPVKHCYVNDPKDWKYSSIHTFIKNGILPADWFIDVKDAQGFGE